MRCLTQVNALAVVAVIVCGCSPKSTPPKPPVRMPPAFSSLPVELRVKQRSTTRIPSSDLQITIEDITRGQVVVSLANATGGVVLAPNSLKEGHSVTFAAGGGEYHLTLQKLNNELIGDDFATFVISSSSMSARDMPVEGNSTSPPPSTRLNENSDGRRSHSVSERDTIERLLVAIENEEGATFIRNDNEYSAKEAAEHLRFKWAAATDQIHSADEFIDQIASRSSLSGEAYRVRLANGTVVTARDYLRERLRKNENNQAGVRQL